VASKFRDIPRLSINIDGMDPKIGLDLHVQPKWNIPDTIVVKCAVVGGPIKRAKNPHHPYTPDEIRTESMKCVEAGAVMVHVHTRTDEGNNVIDLDENLRKYHLIVDPIREKYGDNVVIDCNFGTSPTFEDDMALFKTGLSEFTPVNMSLAGNSVPSKRIQAQVQFMQENGIKPEIAVYCDADIDRAKFFLIDTGIIKQPMWWDLLPSYTLGTTPIYDEFSMAESLMWQVRQIRRIDPEGVIMVAGAGRPSSYLVTMAILLGLHVKVGMEDTYFKWPHKDDILDSNAEAIAETISIAKNLGRRVATANECRALGGLPER
jgi:3-keto-5-aminohexanoate cleavage enzyme